MAIKEAAAKIREAKFKKKGKPYYTDCLFCNLDCRMITDSSESKYVWEHCPKHENKMELM